PVEDPSTASFADLAPIDLARACGSWKPLRTSVASVMLGSALDFFCPCCGYPCFHEVDREWKHYCRAPFARDIEKRDKIPKLHSLRHRRQDLCGIEQFLCGLLLALSINDLGTTGTFGLGLASDRANHALVEVDALDLNSGDLDAPGFGLLIEHVLNVGIELVSLSQHGVKIVLA